MVWCPSELLADEALVRGLLDDQHPEFADMDLEMADAGWDNVVWRLGPDLAVRIPRRETAVPLLANELRWLPGLAARLPLPVPVPLRSGRPGPRYPWSWAVVPWLDGEPGDRMPVEGGGASPGRLGRFLSAMHVEAPSEAPWNPYRSVALAERTQAFEDRLSDLQGRVDRRSLRRLWGAALSARPEPGPPVWIHGDMHPANVLVKDGGVVAVIDFGDVCAGDRATDLAAVWMILPEGDEEAFWRSYGRVDADTRLRALGWTVLFGLMLFKIGLGDRPSYVDAGRSALERALAEAG